MLSNHSLFFQQGRILFHFRFIKKVLLSWNVIGSSFTGGTDKLFGQIVHLLLKFFRGWFFRQQPRIPALILKPSSCKKLPAIRRGVFHILFYILFNYNYSFRLTPISFIFFRIASTAACTSSLVSVLVSRPKDKRMVTLFTPAAS